MRDAVDDDDVVVEVAAGRLMVDEAPFALLVEARVLDGEQRDHEHVDEVFEHLRRLVALESVEIRLDVVEHPVKALRELRLREVFDRRQAQRQGLEALEDGRRLEDKGHARLAAVGAPHREPPLAALARAVLRDAGQISVRDEALLILIEVTHHRVEHVLAPVEARREMLDALAPVVGAVDRLVEQLDAVVDLAVVIHAGRRTHPERMSLEDVDARARARVVSKAHALEPRLFQAPRVDGLKDLQERAEFFISP